MNTKRKINIFFCPIEKIYSSGFTYIELIIVMSIIGIMSGFFVNRYTGLQKTARDTQRKNDLRQYQTAIEGYANSHSGFYPVHSAKYAAFSICTDLSLGATCAKDPKDNQSICSSSVCRYYYQSNSGGTSYVLWGALERPIISKYWTICSDGAIGESAAENTCP